MKAPKESPPRIPTIAEAAIFPPKLLIKFDVSIRGYA
jgi:hypothetical protein